MRCNLLIPSTLLLAVLAGGAVAGCPKDSPRMRLQTELAQVEANIDRGHRIRSHAEAGFSTTAQRVPVMRPGPDGVRRLSGEWMTRHVYLDPDDPKRPLDPARLHAPIDPQTEAQRRDLLHARLDALGGGCG